MRIARRVVVAAALQVLSGCQDHFVVPEGAKIICEAKDDCPESYVCHNHRCSKVDAFDATPPDLAEAPVVTPSAGRKATAFEIVLVVTEALAAPATLTLGFDQPVELACPATSPLRHVCAYVATGEENGTLGGVVPFDVKLVDTSQNETVKRRAGALELDFSAPTVASASVAPAEAKLGTQLQLFFTASERLAGPAVLTVRPGLNGGADGGAMTVDLEPEVGTLNYRFQHAVTAADPLGPVTFSVALEDRAGNRSASIELGVIAIDHDVPRLVTRSASPLAAREGTVVEVLFEVSKVLAGEPSVTLGGVAMQRDASVAHPRYRYTHAAALLEGNGPKAVLVQAFDRSGNQLFEPVGTVTYDFIKPRLLRTDASPALARVGQTMLYTVIASEPLGQTPALRATRQGTGVPVVFAHEAGTEYVFSLTAAAEPGGTLDGPFEVAVDLVDLAGNPAVAQVGTTFALDLSVPQVTNLAVTPARIDETGTVTATFDVSEAVPAAGIQVTVGGQQLPCAPRQAASPQYTCIRAMVGNELLPGTEASQAVVVSATDLAGNAGQAQGAVVFDFKDPTVASAVVTYLPGAGNPLTTVLRAKAGTTLRVKVVPDEPLALAASLTMTATNGATTLTFSRTAADATGVTFEVVVPSTAVDGDYVPAVTFEDLVGNRGTVTFATPGLVVKTSTPALVIKQAQVTFLSSPWGNAAPETLGELTVPAGREYALTPGDPLSGATLLSDTFAFASADPLVRVRVVTAATSGALLADVSPNPDGTWPRSSLGAAAASLPSLFVTGVDNAGNESPAVKVATNELVMTTNPVTGPSTHKLQVTELTKPQLSGGSLVTAGAGAAGADATAILARARAAWTDRNPPITVPALLSTRQGAAMAYDAARGKVVLFGGYTGLAYQQDTWEFDGSTWALLTPTVKPTARQSARMAYDAARRRVVLFGGLYSASGRLADTWEWDGVTWLDRTPATPSSSPSARSNHSMAYDGVRERVVLYGGLASGTVYSDTWEWDGTTWADRNPQGLTPGTSAGAGMTWDEGRGRVLLLGGSGANFGTWEWDGTAWAKRTPTGLSPPSGGGELVYDARRGRSVFVHITGGSAGVTSVWEWDGSGWTDRTVTSPRPSGRSGFSATWSGARGRVMVFGGYLTGSTYANDTWEWDGPGWLARGGALPSAAQPPGRYYHSLASDTVRGRVVLFGGSTLGAARQDTWEWDGTNWADRTPAGLKPSARYSAAMAFDAARGRVVLFGGYDINTGVWPLDTWEWDGTVWVDKTPALTSPSGRTGHAMTWDAARNRVVLFGGGDTVARQDTWEWDGTTWVDKTPAGAKPSARGGVGMTYDATRAQVVLFGGNTSSGSNAETWTWDGAVWANRTPTGASPSPRTGPGLAWDPRGFVTLFGGDAGPQMQDTWVWNGTLWAERLPGPRLPTPRTQHAMVYDAARLAVVLFGGQSGVFESDVWEWSRASGRWTERVPVAKPQARAGHALSADPVRGKTVLFGGLGAAGRLADLWEWDGATFVAPVLGATRPTARSGTAMAYDATRNVTVLFGGFDGAARLADTWEWDGTSLVDRTPTGLKPPAREGHRLAFDAARSRTVLFGGFDGVSRLADVWEWDGTTWVDKTPTGLAPSARDDVSMTFDPTGGAVVIAGGYSGTARLDDVWKWNGTGFAAVPLAAGGPGVGRGQALLALDQPGHLFAFGGDDGVFRADTWDLDLADTGPALQFTATMPASVPLGSATGLRVRAHCGGALGPSGPLGASLFGWAGGWRLMATNVTGLNAASPWLPAPPSALIDFSAASLTDVNRFVPPLDRTLAFQCRAAGPFAGNAFDPAVALDYLEVRLRYAAP